MASIIQKTFGGLSKEYYIRHFLFGLLILGLFLYPTLYRGFEPHHITHIIVACVLQLLYPYARFVYESVVEYIVGNNTFFVSAIVLLGVKLFSMMVCWFFSWLIAPIGLAWLYWYHSKQEQQVSDE